MIVIITFKKPLWGYTGSRFGIVQNPSNIQKIQSFLSKLFRENSMHII